MAQGEKPYRVYRGGRVKGRVPTLGETGARTGPHRPEALPRSRAPGRSRRRRRARRNWRRRIVIGVVVVLRPRARLGRRELPRPAQRREGREQAAAQRSAKAALVPQSGLILSHPSVILLLGTDHSSRIRERDGLRALGLDDAPAHRPGEGAPELPLDPARSARQRPRARLRQDQLRLPARRAGARDPDRARLHGRRGQPRRRSSTSTRSRR